MGFGNARSEAPRWASRGTVSKMLVRAALVLAVALPDLAAGQQERYELLAGLEYSRGDYGGTEALSDMYSPVTVRYTRERLGLRLTVPYLRVEFPVLDTNGDPLSGRTRTEGGLGDVILGATLYDVFDSPGRGIAFDFTGKVKLATADADKSLGTGERDYSLQGDLYKFLPRTTLIATLGYKIRGHPTGVTLEDAWYAALGASRRFSSGTRAGLVVDYREPAIASNESIVETTAFVSRRINARWWIQAHVLHGAGSSSPNWGSGVSFATMW
jgi:Putative MetA-pathway of phenol degradation